MSASSTETNPTEAPRPGAGTSAAAAPPAGIPASPPSGEDLTPREKACYLKALVSMASADDALAPAELAKLHAAAERLGRRLAASDLRSYSLDGIARGIERPSLRRSLVDEMAEVADADGRVVPDELAILKHLAGAWGLEPPRIAGVDWAKVEGSAVAPQTDAAAGTASGTEAARDLDLRTRKRLLARARPTLRAARPAIRLGWVAIAFGITLFLQVLGIQVVWIAREAGMLDEPGALLAARLIMAGCGFFFAGFAVGELSPGRTVLEAWIAATAVAIVVLALDLSFGFLPFETPLAMGIAAAAPSFLALLGAWIGELSATDDRWPPILRAMGPFRRARPGSAEAPLGGLDPKDLSVAEKGAVLRALLTIASADDVVTPEEAQKIRRVAGYLSWRVKAKDLAGRRFSLYAISRAIEREPLRKAVLREVVAVASADRRIDPDETQVLKFLCDKWQLPYPDGLGVTWPDVDVSDLEGLERRLGDELAHGKRVALAAARPDFQWRWVGYGMAFMTSVVLLGLALLRAAQMADWVTTEGEVKAALGASFAAALFLGGALVGSLSPGRTLVEPGLAAALVSVVAGFLGYGFIRLFPPAGYRGVALELVPLAVLAFLLGLAGGVVGEALQARRQRGALARGDLT